MQRYGAARFQASEARGGGPVVTHHKLDIITKETSQDCYHFGSNTRAEPQLVKITVSKENYLKAIAEAHSEGETVIAATLARWLNVTPPAVATAVKRLRRDGLITVDDEGRIALTAAGEEVANRVLNRHHLIERMLADIFGMEWYKVHDEAEQLEHAVSEEFEQRLREKLGDIEVCPHGNRVKVETPEDKRRRGLMPLHEAPVSARARVVSVYERDRKLLEYLDGLGIRPGAELELVARNYDGTLALRVEGREVSLGEAAAAKLWVEPLDPVQ